VGESNWPTDTITFLFSDIEGSTELAARLGAAAFRKFVTEIANRKEAAPPSA